MGKIYTILGTSAREIDMESFIAAQLAKPKTHTVLTTYADGTVKEHQTASLAQAKNWAIGESRKLGRDLIDRATGKTVRVVSVETKEI
jgi:hypothetical protein